jgi:hypothetical protein
MRSLTEHGQQIPFLDTILIIDNDRNVEVAVYRKSILTQTNIYHLVPTTLTRVNELLLKAYLIVLKTFPQQFQTKGMNKSVL